MKWLRLAKTRLFGLLNKRRIEAEMEEELRFHLQLRTEDHIASGFSAGAGRRNARRR